MVKTDQDFKYAKVNIEEESWRSEKGNRKYLYLSTFVAFLNAYAIGTTFGWTSPILPKLLKNSENTLPKPISHEEAALIGSLLPLGALIGPFLLGPLNDKIGRKKTLLLSTLPLIIGFVLSAYATSKYAFYVARFFWGLTTGVSFIILSIYIGEIAEAEVRGILATAIQIFIVIGLLFSYIVGPFVTIQNFNLLCLIVPIIFFFWFWGYMPETPHFYVMKGKERDAELVLMKLRGKSAKAVNDELKLIISSTKEAMKNKGSFKDIFKSSGLKKAFFISIGLMSFQQFSGINIILYYTQGIFQATGSSIDAITSTIIIGVVKAIGGFITPLFIEKKGKRFLLLVSAVFMGIPLGFLGAYFYAKDQSCNIDGFFWLPVICLIIYMIAYCLGAGPLPWAVLGEIFPANIKSVASAIVGSYCWLLAFILTLSFKTIVDLIGNSGGFMLFAIFCIVGAILINKYVPETSGKSLQEIQDMLEGRS